MPDFAPNYTARLRVTYTVAGATHHTTWRLPAASGYADIGVYAAKFIALLDIMDAKIWSDFTINSWSYQLADGVIFLPFGGAFWAAGGVSPSGRSPSQKALALSFVGRSVAGQRAAFFLYGVATNPMTDTDTSDFRIHSAEDTIIGNAVGILNDTSPSLVANDNEDVIWYEYANVKYNDYWTRRLRQGA